MADTTGISWTHKTYNPWIGCTRVSPACDNCYAEAWASKRGWQVWGPHIPRHRTAVTTRKQALRWNREAARLGIRYRVFTLSLGDVMDGEIPAEWRQELWEVIDSTPNLDWQLLTKRPENYHRFLPEKFKHNNVWFGTTAEDQGFYDSRWPTLGRLRERFPEAPLWISYEPALGPITLRNHDQKPDWIIFGGESGKGSRPMEDSWAEHILEECRELEVAFFMKQMASVSLVKAKTMIPDNLRVRQYPDDMDSPFVILDNKGRLPKVQNPSKSQNNEAAKKGGVTPLSPPIIPSVIPQDGLLDEIMAGIGAGIEYLHSASAIGNGGRARLLFYALAAFLDERGITDELKDASAWMAAQKAEPPLRHRGTTRAAMRK